MCMLLQKEHLLSKYYGINGASTDLIYEPVKTGHTIHSILVWVRKRVLKCKLG